MSQAYLVAGLGYGDEGKGSIVDFLTATSGVQAIVRYNGGPQASHHVVHERVMHCYSQFGSGMFLPGTKTALSRHMLIDLLALEKEAKALHQKNVQNPYERLTIDPRCLLVTPFQIIIGQMRELIHEHGSCGRGIGETVRDGKWMNDAMLYAQDLLYSSTLKAKLDFLWHVKLDQAQQLVNLQPHNVKMQERYQRIQQRDLVETVFDSYRKMGCELRMKEVTLDSAETVLFEGAQGVLLDQQYGFWPHVTKTRTTFENTKEILTANGKKMVRVGVLRAYMTRHGNGPLISEDEKLTSRLPEAHNIWNEWQGNMRVGWLDLVATRYALDVLGGVDYLALTNMDRLSSLGEVKVCRAYEYRGENTIDESIIDEFFLSKRSGDIKIIEGIRKPECPTVERQERLTRLLRKCTPVYEKVAGESDKYTAYVERALRTPLGIVSVGMERGRKRFV